LRDEVYDYLRFKWGRVNMEEIKELILEDISRRDKEYKESHPPGYWHPSSYGRCYRLQFYQKSGVEEGSVKSGVPLVGTILHKYVQGLLPQDCVEVGELDAGKGIHWSADYVKKEVSTVYDFKFPMSYGFRYVNKKGFDFRDQKKTNILQLTGYAMELRVENCCLTFFNRDNILEMVSFEFKAQEFVSEVEEELGILNGFWSQGRLPPASPKAFNGRDCQYCSFVNTCEEEKGSR
jgi:hypothetical protein